MAQSFDICIRGAGIVGRTLALLLARERLRVALVAAPALPMPDKPDKPDIRAYALNAASKALLESVRCWPDSAFVTPVHAMQVRGDHGGEVNFSAPISLHESAGEKDGAALAWIVDVPALEARLLEAVRYQPLVEVVSEPQPAALTVVCEGRASRTRAEFGVEFDVTPYAQHAIAARLHCEKPHAQVARQWFCSDGGILALLPLDGPSTVALVWSAPEAAAPGLLALSPEAFCQHLERASQQVLGSLSLISDRAAWPLQLARARHWCGVLPASTSINSSVSTSACPQHWVLAGDAAHNVHPLSGQGLNLGLADVHTLAQVLQGRDYWRSVGDMRLLRRYERTRKSGVLPMGWATDGLQQLFALPAASVLRNWGMRRFEDSGPVKAWVARQATGV